MNANILIAPKVLEQWIAEDACVVVDCRFDLGQPEKGYRDYLAGHIPSARYADLNRDLSSPVTPNTGRHPLPEARQFAEFLARLGWNGSKTLVVYDERNSTIAVRLWWLMKYFGQTARILDGGMSAWVAAGLQLEPGQTHVKPVTALQLSANPGLTTSAAEILETRGTHAMVLVDARAKERFRGEVEPLDQKAGHIPGSLNRPTSENLDESGRFKNPDVLRSEFEQLIPGRAIHSVVNTCGSGVTACHNAFAIELAGMGPTRVYPGSWSEWIRDDSRPIELGPGARQAGP